MRNSPAWVLHLMGIFYMFAGLAIICDDYFVPALEVITERLDLSEDVAGATFMAAGGSAPELFTSVIGVFIAQSNVGFGTIVGSAVFNVLFVIGACAVATMPLANDLARQDSKRTGEPMEVWYHRGLPLTAWPLARDSTFYAIDLIVLLVFFLDEEIWWWEALIMLCLYVCYVIFMKNNEKAQNWVTATFGKGNPTPNAEVRVQAKEQRSASKDAEMLGKGAQSPVQAEGEGGEDCGLIRTESRSVIKKTQREVNCSQRRDSRGVKTAADGEGGKNSNRHSDAGDAEKGDEKKEDGGDDDDEGGPWAPGTAFAEARDSGVADIAKFFIYFPLNIVLYLTVPNCQNEEKRKGRFTYIISFVMSIAWIGVFTYFMVWWAETLTETISGEDDDGAIEVTGLVLLAAGTSVPDLITSVVVARAGHGDMAVSSSIGSNIFDICFGLPLPWFLYGVFVNLGKCPIPVKSSALGSSVIMLFAMLIATIACIAGFGWRLNVALGATAVFFYCIFITIYMMIAIGPWKGKGLNLS